MARVEGLERAPDLRSGLGGAARAACDLQAPADLLVTHSRFLPAFPPHLSVNKGVLPQAVDLRRGDGERGVARAQREAAQRDPGFRRSFQGQAQEVQEGSTWRRFRAGLSRAKALVNPVFNQEFPPSASVSRYTCFLPGTVLFSGSSLIFIRGLPLTSTSWVSKHTGVRRPWARGGALGLLPCTRSPATAAWCR